MLTQLLPGRLVAQPSDALRDEFQGESSGTVGFRCHSSDPGKPAPSFRAGVGRLPRTGRGGQDGHPEIVGRRRRSGIE
ncbi:hypothetical protein GCM10010169_50980 [Micromonospora fulviviridis]|nr:hypothetical protein GCM10010169_50980 [Micromonospora fulviviridis]